MKSSLFPLFPKACWPASALLFIPGFAEAQVQWSLPSAGSYLTPGNWAGGAVPAANADASVNLTGAVVRIVDPDVVGNKAFTATRGRIEMSGGTLISTDKMTVPAAGGSILISGGNATVRAFQITDGSGTVSGGTVSAIVDVRALGTGKIDVSGGTLIAGKLVASGNVTVSNSALITMSQATNNELWIGATANATLTLKDNAQLNHESTLAANPSVVIGRGNIGTLLIQDHASFSTLAGSSAAKAIQVGSAVGSTNGVGTIQLNGGTITAFGLVRGATGTIHSNGGTFRAVAANTNYFNNFSGTGGDNSVNLQAGGLKFDTNSFAVTIANGLAGPGGLTKLGTGVLTLSANNTYAGDTVVSGGELVMNLPTLADAAGVTVTDGGVLNLPHGSRDVVASLKLGETTYTSGSWGSTASAATHKSDVYFKGTGTIHIGTPPPPRSLVWTGAVSSNWAANAEANFLSAGSPTFFESGDRVTFSQTSPARVTVNLVGPIETSGVTFGGTSGYTVLGAGSGLSGAGGIVSDTPGTVFLGGENSTFSGPIQVNNGKLVMADHKSFGTSSGITIAPGAQVDINGREPGALYTYRISGTGPDGQGLIVNSGEGRFGNAGVKNLVLTGNAAIGGSGRFDVGQGGSITGNGFTLTKVGTADLAFRGNASGTPINYVIAAGRGWAEDHDHSLGGAGGSVTVLGGASTGSYGTRTIATPVSIQSGGTLVNLGNGKSTWTGTFTLSGDVTIDATGGAIDLTGIATGNASVTKIGPNPVLMSTAHNGGTVVLQGALKSAGGFNPNASLIIASGASVDVPAFETAYTVQSLVLGPIVAEPGSEWGPAGSGAPHESEWLTGSNRLLVSGSPPASQGYLVWAVSQQGLAGANALPNADPDGDGVRNALEFVLGTDPSSSVLSDMPTAQVTADHLEFIFNRRSALSGYVPVAQFSTNLVDWTDAVEGQPAQDPVEISSGPRGTAGIDRIVVRVPKALAEGRKIFCRLKVTFP